LCMNTKKIEWSRSVKDQQMHHSFNVLLLNPLTPNDLQSRSAVSPIKIKIPNKNMREKNKYNNYSFSLLIM
jgi:hypothetical protein